MTNTVLGPSTAAHPRVRWKTIWLFLAGMVGSLYTTFVVQCLWNWFVVAAFHTTEISFWVMYGLIMLLRLFASEQDLEIAEEQRWTNLFTLLEYCVPSEFREEAMNQVKEKVEGMWVEFGAAAFGKLVGNTITLALGFCVHAFLT
jgi:hypothetical protein